MVNVRAWKHINGSGSCANQIIVATSTAYDYNMIQRLPMRTAINHTERYRSIVCKSRGVGENSSFLKFYEPRV